MNYQSPKVSVIIPNYNHSFFLKKRIESVINQSFQDFEVLILDDCSTDNSVEIIENYRSHSKIAGIFYNDQNSGSTFKQWEKGIALAKGDWIWIAESDDYCDNNLLEKLIANSLQMENVVLSYCQSYEIDEQGKILGDLSWSTGHLDKNRWSRDFFNDGSIEIERFLLYQNTIPNASAVIFKKHAYLEADKKFVKMKLCGDWMLWVQLLKQGNIAFNGEALNYFRTHPATTRVIDSFAKRKLRLEEEYEIVIDIHNSMMLIDNSMTISRMKNIQRRYASVFPIKEIIRLIFNPFSYKSKISLNSLFINYINYRISKYNFL